MSFKDPYERLYPETLAKDAAPDLLEALEDITHAYVRELGRSAARGFDPEETPLVKKARAVIREARGER